MMQMNGLMLFGCIIFLFISGAFSLSPQFDSGNEKIHFGNSVFADSFELDCTVPSHKLINAIERKLSESDLKRNFFPRSLLAEFYSLEEINVFNRQYSFQFLRNPISLSISDIIFPFHLFW